MLVPKIKPCMSKYKQVYTVKLRMAHYISYNLFDSLFTTWITVVILELIHAKSPTSGRAVFIRLKTNAGNRFMVIHNNFADRMALRRRRFIQISALSTFDGRIEAYHGFYG